MIDVTKLPEDHPPVVVYDENGRRHVIHNKAWRQARNRRKRAARKARK